jgi:tetratricopeptide (TPR) repeat protein
MKAAGTLVLLLSVFWLIPAFSQDQATVSQLRRDVEFHRNDTAGIRLNYQLSLRYTASGTYNADSALYYAGKALELSGVLNHDALLFDIYTQYSYILQISGNYSIAMEYLFTYLGILDNQSKSERDKLPDMEKYLKVYTLIANCYIGLNELDKSLEYYQKSLAMCDQIRKEDSSFDYESKIVVIYSNLGSVYINKWEFDKALQYYRMTLGYLQKENNPAYLSSAYNNIGIIYKAKEQYDSAFFYYNKALEIRKMEHDLRGLAQVYTNIGDCYYQVKDYSKAISTLNEAISLGKRTGALATQMKAANFLSDAYAKTGDYSNALAMHKLFKQLNDSIINDNNIKRTTQLELQYEFDKKQKVSELVQQMALAKKERKALVAMLVAGILLLSFMVMILFYILQRYKMAKSRLIQQNLELESKHLQLEKQHLNEDLEFRNKELTTHVMYLLKKNEFLISVSDKLMEIHGSPEQNDGKQILDIVRELRSNVDSTVWEEFEVRFQQVHQDFYHKLNEAFPDLTPNEKKLCAFLHLNMTTKDISSITFQSPKSIQVARTRLRKRLGIDRDENLVSFLQQI